MSNVNEKAVEKKPYIKIQGTATPMSSRQVKGVKIHEFTILGNVIQGGDFAKLPKEKMVFNVIDVDQNRSKYLRRNLGVEIDVEVAGYYYPWEETDANGNTNIIHVIEAKYVRIIHDIY